MAGVTWQRARSSTGRGGPGERALGSVFAFLSPVHPLQKGVPLFLHLLLPMERLVAAMLGPSVAQPSQLALHCACSVHSLGLLPFGALSPGWSAKEGWHGKACCLSCSAAIPSPVWALAWALWLLRLCHLPPW